jgi:hypothetical protein
VKPFKTKTNGSLFKRKELVKGMLSFYLDIYHNKRRWYEFLKIKINKNHPTEQDKEKKRLAHEIRSKWESELIVQDNGLLDRNKRKADFVKWFEKYIKAKNHNTQNAATLSKLKTYLRKRPLPFTAINPQWIKGFTNFMLIGISNNYFEEEKTEDIEYLPLSDQAIEIIKERENEIKTEI